MKDFVMSIGRHRSGPVSHGTVVCHVGTKHTTIPGYNRSLVFNVSRPSVCYPANEPITYLDRDSSCRNNHPAAPSLLIRTPPPTATRFTSALTTRSLAEEHTALLLMPPETEPRNLQLAAPRCSSSQRRPWYIVHCSLYQPCAGWKHDLQLVISVVGSPLWRWLHG